MFSSIFGTQPVDERQKKNDIFMNLWIDYNNCYGNAANCHPDKTGITPQELQNLNSAPNKQAAHKELMWNYLEGWTNLTHAMSKEKVELPQTNSPVFQQQIDNLRELTKQYVTGFGKAADYTLWNTGLTNGDERLLYDAFNKSNPKPHKDLMRQKMDYLVDTTPTTFVQKMKKV